jgi:hypothetical protein
MASVHDSSDSWQSHERSCSAQRKDTSERGEFPNHGFPDKEKGGLSATFAWFENLLKPGR